MCRGRLRPAARLAGRILQAATHTQRTCEPDGASVDFRWMTAIETYNEGATHKVIRSLYAMSAKFVFGSSASYLAVTIVDNAARLLLLPWMTRILSPADYGVMLLIGNGAALINLLFGFVLGQALPSMFSNALTDASRRSVATTIIFSMSVVLSTCYLAAFLLSREISVFFLHTATYEVVIKLGAFSALMSALALCLVPLVRLVEQHKLYLFIQMPALVFQIGLLAGFIATSSLTINSQYIAIGLGSLFTTVAYAFVLKRWLTGGFQLSKLAEAARVGAQILPWQLALFLTTSSAGFFLTRTGHVDESGLLLVASGAAGILVLLSGSFEGVWTAFVLRRKDQPDIAGTQVRIFSLYSAALLMAASALCIFAHELFVIMAGPNFRNGYLLVPGLAAAYCLFCFVNGFAQGLQARQRTIHYAWIGAVASATFAVLAISLTPGYGAWGIIAAMITSFLVMLVLLQTVSAKFMPVAYPWIRHGLMLLSAAAIVYGVFSLEVGWSSFAIKLIALAGIALLTFAFGAIGVSDLRVPLRLISRRFAA